MRPLLFAVSILVLASLVSAIAFAGDDQYFVRHGQDSDNLGPYSESEVRMRLKEGIIKPNDYIWSAPMKKWAQISNSPIFGRSKDHRPASDQSPPPFSGDEQNNKQIENDAGSVPVETTDNRISYYVTPLIGLSFPVNNAQGGPYFTFAGEAGFHIKAASIGIFASTISNSATSNGITASATVTSLMLSLTSQSGVFYYGGRFGLGSRSISESASGVSLSASGSSFAVAPVIGVRLPIQSNISIDIETSWQVIASGNVSGTLGSATLTSVGYLVPLAGAKITF